MNCPINEQTGDGTIVGRCWFYLKDGKICPRHGDVSISIEYFNKNGKIMLEKDFISQFNEKTKKEVKG